MSYGETMHKEAYSKTPCELMTPVSNGFVPSVDNLFVFGSPCFAYAKKDLHKPEHHNCVAIPGIFIGYAHRSSSYLVYLSVSKRVVVRNTIRCDKDDNCGIEVLKGPSVLTHTLTRPTPNTNFSPTSP